MAISTRSAMCVFLLASTPVLAADGKLVSYRCNNSDLISVTFTRQQALLTYNGRVIPLAVTPSAGGARYANGPYVLWNKGSEVRVEIDDKPALDNCKETREGLDAPPPFHMGGGEGLKIKENKP